MKFFIYAAAVLMVTAATAQEPCPNCGKIHAVDVQVATGPRPTRIETAGGVTVEIESQIPNSPGTANPPADLLTRPDLMPYEVNRAWSVGGGKPDDQLTPAELQRRRFYQRAYDHAKQEAQFLASQGPRRYPGRYRGHPMGTAPGCRVSGTGYSHSGKPNHCYMPGWRGGVPRPDSDIVARACVFDGRRYWWSAHYGMGGRNRVRVNTPGVQVDTNTTRPRVGPVRRLLFPRRFR